MRRPAAFFPGRLPPESVERRQADYFCHCGHLARDESTPFPNARRKCLSIWFPSNQFALCPESIPREEENRVLRIPRFSTIGLREEAARKRLRCPSPDAGSKEKRRP